MSRQSNRNNCRHRPWRRYLWLILAVIAVDPPGAQAQLRLPSLPSTTTTTTQLPQPPVEATTATRRLDALVTDAVSELDSQSQKLLRKARVRALLRANGDTLETDPAGAPVLRSQVVSLSPTPQSLQAAIAAGFVIIEDQAMDELSMRVVTLRAPAGMSARRAVQRLRAMDREGSYDYNHVYTQSATDSAAATAPASGDRPITKTSYPNSRVGLIDGGVEATHSVFNGNSVHSWGCDAQAMPSAHGTAVASLLVGNSERFSGAAPGAALYAADVYCDQPVGGSMTRIAAAMTWLAQQRVPVINMSLVGPDNALLKQLTANLVARGYLLVAAVGNDGPAAPPLYPAAYPGVVGVTATDAHNRAIVEAGRGKQVMFAAPGADMVAATLQDAFVKVRGTSFAAPLVAGLLATHVDKPQPDIAKAALASLIGNARDLGTKGFDKTFGYGMVGEFPRTALK